MAAAADTRYIPFGFDNGVASLTDVYQLPVTRDGTLQSLFVRHNTVGGVGSIEYTVLVNGIATGLTVTLSTNAVGQLSDLLNTFPVVQGDRISLRGIKPSLILLEPESVLAGTGLVHVAISLELV